MELFALLSQWVFGLVQTAAMVIIALELNPWERRGKKNDNAQQ